MGLTEGQGGAAQPPRPPNIPHTIHTCGEGRSSAIQQDTGARPDRSTPTGMDGSISSCRRYAHAYCGQHALSMCLLSASQRALTVYFTPHPTTTQTPHQQRETPDADKWAAGQERAAPCQRNRTDNLLQQCTERIPRCRNWYVCIMLAIATYHTQCSSHSTHPVVNACLLVGNWGAGLTAVPASPQLA